jgi:hypothetical protein
MPSRDPVVEEVRAARDVIAGEFDYDVERLGRSLQARHAKGERPVVRLPPRLVTPEKKAG